MPLGSNNSGRVVGGSMVHCAGYTPRFHPSDFETLTQDGVGADWPLSYGDLLPYYRAIEDGAAGRRGTLPWGDPHGSPTARTRSAATGRRSCAAPGSWTSRRRLDRSPGGTVGVMHGLPGRSLVDAARTLGAELLVVGSRSEKAMTWLLGSQYVLRNSPCPVLVVPDTG